jgi:hypothetical protein
MELRDLKNSWDDITDQVSRHEILNVKMIDQMTISRYRSSLKKIAYPEMIGSIICLGGAVFIFLNFAKLDSSFLVGTGIVSIFLLLIIPLISLLSVQWLRVARDLNKTHAESLKEFALQKIRFHKLQRINVTASYLLLVGVIILLAKFFGGKDIAESKYFWILSFSIGYIFLSFYSKWVLKKYDHSLARAEELLKELSS